MLKNLINKKVTITYEAGYNYKNIKGVVTKTTTNFIELDNKTLINIQKIIKVTIKE